MLVKEKSPSLTFLDTLQAQNEVCMLGGIPLFFKHVIYIGSLLHARNNKLLSLLLLNQSVDVILPVVIWEQSGCRKL